MQHSVDQQVPGVVDIILRNGRQPIRTEAYKTFNHADEAILSSERGKTGSMAHPAGAGEGDVMGGGVGERLTPRCGTWGGVGQSEVGHTRAAPPPRRRRALCWCSCCLLTAVAGFIASIYPFCDVRSAKAACCEPNYGNSPIWMDLLG